MARENGYSVELSPTDIKRGIIAEDLYHRIMHEPSAEEVYGVAEASESQLQEILRELGY